MSFDEVRRHNQATRQSVHSWINRQDWEAPPSLYNYGLPGYVFHLINADIGEVPIQHDMLSYFGKLIEDRIHPKRFRMLEIGVSVGKSLYTQMNIFQPESSIFALDVEDINPSFAKLLDRREVLSTWTEEELPAGVGTTRRSDIAKKNGHEVDSMTTYTLKGRNGPTLTYLAGDEWSEVSWRKLQSFDNHKFQVILSDALHTREALLYEWKMIKDKSLLDKIIFAYVWDDCDGTLRAAFSQIVQQFSAENNVFFCSAVFSIHGWLGAHEPSHPTCVLTTLDLRELMKDCLFGSIQVIQEIVCQHGKSL
jgi:hypothetical protein